MFVAPAFAQPAAELPGEAGTLADPAPQPESNFPPFDASTFSSQILWLAITFGLFYLFLKRVILPRIDGILEDRQGRIASDLDEAARAKDEADAAVAAYEQELAEARNKATQIGQSARDDAKKEAEAERRKTEAGLETQLSEAEARIAGIKDAALRDVGAIAEGTAGLIVERLTGGKPDKAAVSTAVRAAAQQEA